MSDKKLLKEIEHAKTKIHKLFLKEISIADKIMKVIKKKHDLHKSEEEYLNDYIKKSTGRKDDVEKILKKTKD